VPEKIVVKLDDIMVLSKEECERLERIAYWEVEDDTVKCYDEDGNYIDTLYIDSLVEGWISDMLKRCKRK